MRVVHLYSSLVTNKKSLNNFPWLLKSAECFYRTRNTRIQYIGDKCRVSVRFSVVGVHCHSLVLLPLAVTEHINVYLKNQMMPNMHQVLHLSTQNVWHICWLRLTSLILLRQLEEGPSCISGNPPSSLAPHCSCVALLFLTQTSLS